MPILPQNNQNVNTPVNQGMTADQSAAALSFATMLSEGLLPKAPQTPEMAPGGEETLEMEETVTPEESESIDDTLEEPEEPVEEKENPQITQLAKEFDEFKGKIEGVIDTKFNDLTKTIRDALK